MRGMNERTMLRHWYSRLDAVISLFAGKVIHAWASKRRDFSDTHHESSIVYFLLPCCAFFFAFVVSPVEGG